MNDVILESIIAGVMISSDVDEVRLGACLACGGVSEHELFHVVDEFNLTLKETI